MTEKKHKNVTDETPQDQGQNVPAGSAPAQDDLLKEIENLKAKSAEYLDGLMRERADFANYRKRVERDSAQSAQDTTGRVAKKYLPVLDDLERALKTRPQEGEGQQWSLGVELIYKKLQDILKSEGVSEAPAEGMMFDPNRHEALSQEVSNTHQSGEIIEVIQKGYMIGERVIRPALVRVAQ
jgi:molecular chaperone GrpE